MTRIEWGPDLETGIRPIDTDHHMLVDILNTLHQEIARGEGERQVGATLKALAQYTDEHFAREEHFMRQAGYPDLGEHMIKHQRLQEGLEQARQSWEAHPEKVAPERLLTFLREWLTRHIQQSDMDYVPYVTGEKKGLSPQQMAALRTVEMQIPANRLDLAERLARALRHDDPRLDQIDALLK